MQTAVTNYIVRQIVLVRATLFNKAQGSVVSNWIGMKFGRIVPQINSQRLTESDFWHNTCHNFKMAAMTSFHVHPPLAAASASARKPTERVWRQFMIHSKFVLV